MAETQRGTSIGPGSDEPRNGIWCRVGNNANVPETENEEKELEVVKEQPWKTHWPPKAFREGTFEKEGEVFMRANQGAAIGRPNKAV